MKKEREFNEPSFQVSPKTAKIVMYVLYVIRVILIAACVWGLIYLFS